MNQLEKFRDIRTFIFDVDGVLTNNEVLVTEDGQLLRTMNVRDGYAIKHAIESGYRICIITGGRSEGVRKRLEMLGVQDIYVNRQEKLNAYEEYIQAYELDEGEILYMGDDLPDYPVMRRVGLPVCPNDAAHELLEIAQYVSPLAGGMGCARDVIQKVMLLHGTWRE
jgi:3-deoxy-D-manno-octulosonate 8-phosphate phosphatase (KDO 8-P phosphatase)